MRPPDAPAETDEAAQARLRNQAAQLRDASPACTREAWSEERCGSFRSSLRELTLIAHKAAQKRKSSVLYDLTLELYDQYFRTVPDDDPSLVTMSFYAGEVLWVLERWTEAAARYRRVVELEPEGKFAKEATYAVKLAEKNAARNAAPPAAP